MHFLVFGFFEIIASNVYGARLNGKKSLNFKILVIGTVEQLKFSTFQRCIELGLNHVHYGNGTVFLLLCTIS